ncbi:hypothetical protein ACIRBX_03425 [Kitasatospora sp. NPDC096147]|uniref:hypothetical protein n=1 Tax=Kitasatospora sp. NPDC096147 TaxID=3364093 RepID=UPI00381E591D
MSEVLAAIEAATGRRAEAADHGVFVRLSIPLPDVPAERWPALLAILGGPGVARYGTTDPGAGDTPSVWAEIEEAPVEPALAGCHYCGRTDPPLHPSVITVPHGEGVVRDVPTLVCSEHHRPNK